MKEHSWLVVPIVVLAAVAVLMHRTSVHGNSNLVHTQHNSSSESRLATVGWTRESQRSAGLVLSASPNAILDVEPVSLVPLNRSVGPSNLTASGTCVDYSCYGPECLSVVSTDANGRRFPGPCKPSPYAYRQRKLPTESRSLASPKENKCLDSREPSGLPPLVSEPKNLDETLTNFKHLTGVHFRNWYDWSGQFTPQEEVEEAATYLSGHEGPNNLYIIRNACLRPTGRMAGYKPRVGRFVGADDVYTVTRVKKSMKHFVRFLGEVEALKAPPTHFLDTPLVMMPVIGRSSNPGHCFHRTASLFDIRRKAFPNATKQTTTTVFVMSESSRDMASGVSLSDWGSTGFTHYTTVVTQSHFGLIPHREEDTLQKVYGNMSTDLRLLSTLVCFKKIAVYFTCTFAECEAARRRPIGRPILPIYYHRSGDLFRDFNAELRLCAGVVSRLAPRRFGPKILLSLRSGQRRWSFNPQIIASLGNYLHDPIINATLTVHEMKSADMQELVRIYNDVDVVIAPYGAGLFYSVFMPPGSVSLEIGYDHYKCALVSGINRPQNAYCDYGGSFRVLGIHHVLGMFDSFASLKVLGDGFAEFELGLSSFLFLVNRTLCILRSGVDVPGRAECDFSSAQLQALQLHHLQDEDGFALRGLIRNRNVGSLGIATDLPWLYANAEFVASQLRKLRLNMQDARVLIVARCSLNHSAFVAASVFNSYLKLNTRIRLWQPPLPTSGERCPDWDLEDRSLFPGQGSGVNSPYFLYSRKIVKKCEALGASASADPYCVGFHFIFISGDLFGEGNEKLTSDIRRYLLPEGTLMAANSTLGFL